MLKIKLARTGKANERHYRIVVNSDRSKLSGANVAILGHFHPTLPSSASDRLVVDQAAVQTWLSKGAQPTPKIRQLLKLN